MKPINISFEFGLNTQWIALYLAQNVNESNKVAFSHSIASNTKIGWLEKRYSKVEKSTKKEQSNKYESWRIDENEGKRVTKITISKMKRKTWLVVMLINNKVRNECTDVNLLTLTIAPLISISRINIIGK